MKPPPRSHNPKRRIAEGLPPADLEALADRVRYDGNPVHKSNPGDFGLSPPAGPRPHKTLCGKADIFVRSEAHSLLREGIRRGLVSKQRRGDFPQNVWAVSPNGHAVEAALGNKETGTYHGYPMADEDPLRSEVLSRWGTRR